MDKEKLRELNEANKKVGKQATKRVIDTFGRVWTLNAALNKGRVMESYKKSSKSAHNVPLPERIDPDEPVDVLIQGSGYSLDWLDTKWYKNFSGIVFSGSSTADNMIGKGYQPDYLVAVDALAPTIDKMKRIDWKERNTYLMCPPTQYPQVLDRFNEDHIYYFLHPVSKDNEGPNDNWNTFIQYQYPEISVKVQQAGCTVNAQIILTGMMLLRKRFKINRVILAGANFAHRLGYPEHCDAYIEDISNRQIIRQPFPKWNGPKEDEPLKQWRDTDLYVSPIDLRYKQNLLYIWYHTNLPIYTMEKGINTQIPWISSDLTDMELDPKDYNIDYIKNQFTDYIENDALYELSLFQEEDNE